MEPDPGLVFRCIELGDLVAIGVGCWGWGRLIFAFRLGGLIRYHGRFPARIQVMNYGKD